MLDVAHGLAVHATGGDRNRYRPVVSVLAGGADPLLLACAFRDRLGARACYLADLGAIRGGPPDTPLIRSLSQEGLELWIDAAIADATAAERVLAAGATRAVVGLETLPHPDALSSVAAAVPPNRLVFSLDLEGGQLLAGARALATATPLELVDLAFEAGYRMLILLDLARVGTLDGPASELIPCLRARYPDLSLVIGGGVRDRHDLRRLASLGCSGALVGTALHVGRITRADLEAVAAL